MPYTSDMGLFYTSREKALFFLNRKAVICRSTLLL